MNEREEHLARSVRSAAAENNDDNLPVVWIVEQMAIKLREAEERNRQLQLALHEAWAVIANASDWIPKEPGTPCERSRADWQEAAERWRDEQFHRLLSAEPEQGEPAEDDRPPHAKGEPTVRESFHGGYVWTYCDECGPDVKVDEDGLCIACGRDAVYFGKKHPDDSAPTPDGGEGALNEEAELALHDLVWDALKISPRKAVTRWEDKVRRALREPHMPEAVRRLPGELRAGAQEIEGAQPSRWRLAQAAQMRFDADQLDRALAQSEQGRAPTSKELHDKRREQRGKYRPPGGWKLVPVEPTDAMLDAGAQAAAGAIGGQWDIYAAMLAAAPQPQAGEGDE